MTFLKWLILTSWISMLYSQTSGLTINNEYELFQYLGNMQKLNREEQINAMLRLRQLSNLTMIERSFPGQPRESLPRLSIDQSQTSISGFSSGGFMTVQMHFSHSRLFPKGAAVFTGGPLFCTEGFLTSVITCSIGSGAVDVNFLVNNARNWANEGKIDPVDGLRNHKVYIYRGTEDPIFNSPIIDRLRDFYSNFVTGSNIFYRRDIKVGHGWATNHYGIFCPSTFLPGINRCDIDSVGEALQHIYGPLNPRNNGPLTGRYIEFDQDPFAPMGTSMASTGHVYVPETCSRPGARCRLHVVLHGCLQNHLTPMVGTQVVRNVGYNMWADTNRIVMLYPQTGITSVMGCWDFFAYTSNNFANNKGPQVMSIRKMVEHISSG